MTSPDQLLQLRILLTQLSAKVFAALETVAKIEAEIKSQIRSPGLTLEQSERTVLNELYATRTRMDEQLAAILSDA
jgi:hypothetical protein